MTNVYRILVRRHEGRGHSEDLSLVEAITLGWILGEYGEKVWTGFIWLRTGTSGGILVNTVINLRIL
jgi:hypothetical protein